MKTFSVMHLYGIIFMWLLAFATSVDRVKCFNRNLIKICVKEKNVNKTTIVTHTSNFKDFVSRSDIFVDKSLLIKLILEEKNLISMTFPRKWGKSINLDMLRIFLDIELDHEGHVIPINDTWSYKFFKQGVVMKGNDKWEKLVQAPMISRHDDIIDKYLARYPVIIIDLPRYTSMWNSFDDFFSEFRNTVAEMFAKQDSILDVIREKIDLSAVDKSEITKYKNQLKKFRAFKRRDVHEYKEVTNSLQFLSSLLYEHYHQRVVVLIDNYDAPIQLGYFKKLEQVGPKEAHKFMDFFIDFMTGTFIGNENIAKGVLTGIFSLDWFSTSPLGFDYIVNYNALSRNTYPFYGFSAIEVGQLLSRTFTSEFISEVLDRYNGYHTLNYPDITIYNPGLIVDILQKEKITKNWFHSLFSQGPQILPQVLRYTRITKLFHDLVYSPRSAIIPTRNFTLHRDDIISLGAMVNEDDDFISPSGDVALVSMFYVAMGYLTLDFNSMFTNFSRGIKIKTPFKEIEGIIREEYYTNYKK